jgi:hypothetical protein
MMSGIAPLMIMLGMILRKFMPEAIAEGCMSDIVLYPFSVLRFVA